MNELQPALVGLINVVVVVAGGKALATENPERLVPNMTTSHLQQRRAARPTYYDEYYDDDEPPRPQRRPSEAAAPSPSFEYSRRILAVSALPCLILLDFGGGMLRAVASLGVMIGYLLHALQWSEACFVVVWVTVIILALGHASSAFGIFGLSLRALGLSTLAAVQAALMGAWSSLQFEWLPMQEPDLAVLFERLLFNLLPLPSAAIVTWGAGVIWGTEWTVPALLGSLGASYLLLGGALPASFAPRRAASASASSTEAEEANGANTAGDGYAAACLGVCLVVLPPLFHAVLHWPVLLADWLTHARATRTLGCLGLLLLGLPSHAHVCHWAPTEPVWQRIRLALVLAALGGLGGAAHTALLQCGRAHCSLLLVLPDGGHGGLVSQVGAASTAAARAALCCRNMLPHAPHRAAL